MKMPGTRCAVAGCGNSLQKTKVNSESKRVRYHRFPTDLQFRQEWATKCQRDGKWDPASCHVCSEHFTEDDYQHDLKAELLNLPKKFILKKDAVPSINLKKGEECWGRWKYLHDMVLRRSVEIPGSGVTPDGLSSPQMDLAEETEEGHLLGKLCNSKVDAEKSDVIPSEAELIREHQYSKRRHRPYQKALKSSSGSEAGDEAQLETTFGTISNLQGSAKIFSEELESPFSGGYPKFPHVATEVPQTVDPDMQFFKSLVPQLKMLPPLALLKVKAKLLDHIVGALEVHQEKSGASRP